MQLVKDNVKNIDLVLRQIKRAVLIQEEKANPIEQQISRISAAHNSGLITTGEMLNQIKDLEAREPAALQDLHDTEATLLALLNAERMIKDLG